MVTHSQTTINKYEEALDKLNDAFETINNYNKELLRLRPQHDQAVKVAEQRLSEVEQCKAILAAVSILTSIQFSLNWDHF